MNAVTLTSVFLKSEEQLKQSLQGLRLPKDYVELQKAVNSHIESLLVKENDFRNSLNASDAEMLTHALRMALSFQKLSLTESIDFKTLSIRKDYKVNQSTNDNTDIIESVLSLLPTVIYDWCISNGDYSLCQYAKSMMPVFLNSFRVKKAKNGE